LRIFGQVGVGETVQAAIGIGEAVDIVLLIASEARGVDDLVMPMRSPVMLTSRRASIKPSLAEPLARC
jgi:hypothetical protein